jgi:hypothetical protein
MGFGEMGAGELGSDMTGVEGEEEEEEGENRFEGRAVDARPLRERVNERYSAGMGGGTATFFLGDDSAVGLWRGLDACAASMMEEM